MGKLVKKSADAVKSPEETKLSRVKKILDRKEKSKTTENTLLNSAPLSMQNTMNFIKERNDLAKEGRNYGKISESRVGDVDSLADHDIFKNFFQR